VSAGCEEEEEEVVVVSLSVAVLSCATLYIVLLLCLPERACALA